MKTLTANDVALAEMACCLARAWWKERAKGTGGYARREMAKFAALQEKLSDASDAHNPFNDAEDMPLDWGDDVTVYTLTEPAIKEAAA